MTVRILKGDCRDVIRYAAEKRCCTVCEARKCCHVCGDQTLFASSDCQINFNATVYVCGKRACREEHERKCYGSKP